MDVLTSMRIHKGDTGVRDKNYYRTAYKLYFIDKKWYNTNNNKFFLSGIFFSFIVVDITRELYLHNSNLTPEQKENITVINKCLKDNYLVMPIRYFKFSKKEDELMEARVADKSIKFIGIPSVPINTYNHIDNYTAYSLSFFIKNICVFGNWYDHKLEELIGESAKGNKVSKKSSLLPESEVSSDSHINLGEFNNNYYTRSATVHKPHLRKGKVNILKKYNFVISDIENNVRNFLNVIGE